MNMPRITFQKKIFFDLDGNFHSHSSFRIRTYHSLFSILPRCSRPWPPGPTLRVEAKCFNIGLTNLIRILQILLLQSCYLRTPLIECPSMRLCTSSIECQQYAFSLAIPQSPNRMPAIYLLPCKFALRSLNATVIPPLLTL